MELEIDNILTRLAKTERKIDNAIARISALEEQNIKLSQCTTDEVKQEQLQTNKTQRDLTNESKPGDYYTILSDSISDDEDCSITLPPPIITPSHVDHSTPDSYRSQQSFNPHYPHQSSFPHYSPEQSNPHLPHQSSFPHYSPEQSGPVRKSPIHPVQLSNYYNTQSSPNTWSPSTSCMPSMPSASTVPSCLPIQGRRKNDKLINLSSNEINKENLLPHKTVLKKYESLCKENVVGTLAVKLAYESFFGCEVLKQCTVMGCRNYPALPLKELNDLKQLIFSSFPKYWYNQSEFESKIWNTCTNSIGQLCKRLRQ